MKNIELAAQGGKAVVYTARLVGQKDFSLEASTIRVEPGSTPSFAVQFKASTTNPQVGPCSTFAAVHAAGPAWQFKGCLSIQGLDGS